MRLTRNHPLMIIAKQYKVKGIHLGGCIVGKSLGFKGAMRRSAHAHCHKFRNYKPKYYRWICIKSSKVENLLDKNRKPNHLFWHEVSHIYRPARTQQQCDDWADEQVKV